MSHTFHPSIEDAGLADGCGRCKEHATNLVSLDDTNLNELWERTRRWEKGDRDSRPRSNTEGTAMQSMNRVRLIVERLQTGVTL